MPKVQKQCYYCDSSFERYVSREDVDSDRKSRFCSLSCAAKARWAGHEAKTRRLVTVSENHPLCPDTKKRRVFLYRVNLYERIGPGPHPCHWCGDPVNWRVGRSKGRDCYQNELAVDHLDGDIRNDSADNLVPACNACNALRGHIRGWELRTGKTIHSLK